MNFFDDSVFFGVAISILSYGFGILLNNKFKLAIFNPLLISIVATIVVLLVSGIDYKVYNSGAKYLNYLFAFCFRYECDFWTKSYRVCNNVT